MLGVGFPASLPMASRCSSLLSMAAFGGLATIGVSTLGVSLSIVERVFPMFSVGLIYVLESASVLRLRVKCHTEAHLLQIWRVFPASRLVVSWLGIYLPASCLMASRGFPWPDLEFWVVARSASIGSHSRLVCANYGILCRHRAAAGRCATVVPCGFRGLFLVGFSVLSWCRDARRRFSSVVYFASLGSCLQERDLESASRQYASRLVVMSVC
jgi:hypothetical protein